jgi:hypothetical protein
VTYFLVVNKHSLFGLSFVHNFVFIFLKSEKNEMGGLCSADGGGKRRVQDFGKET